MNVGPHEKEKKKIVLCFFSLLFFTFCEGLLISQGKNKDVATEV